MSKNLFFRPELENIAGYEPGKPISEVKAELMIKDVIKLASNECPHLPFPETILALREAASELNRYPDASCTILKQKLARFLSVDEANLVIGNGSSEILRLITSAILNSDNEAIMAKQSFLLYPRITALMGAARREVPLKDFRHDLGAMLEQVNEKTKVIFICNPNNPTGTIVFKEEVDAFLEKLPEGILVIFDEAYFEFVEDARYPNGLDYFRLRKEVAVIRSFSKIYGLAGCRIGYGIARREIISALDKVREPHNVNSLAQIAAAVSLDYQDEVRRRKKLNSAGKNYLYKGLTRLGLSYVPSEANFILVDVRESCREVFQKLLQRGIIVRTGDIFGYDTWIRVTVGTEKENERFIQALEDALKLKTQN